jgi:dynein heavy chain
MDLTEFSEYFETHRVKVITELVKDYQNIGDLYLKHIQESTVKVNEKDKHLPIAQMEKYYDYWERRIFNAITKMIVRALAANKTLFMRKQKPYLIHMTS